MTYILGNEENLLTWPKLLPSNPQIKFTATVSGK
jgi:hypothetical protein